MAMLPLMIAVTFLCAREFLRLWEKDHALARSAPRRLLAFVLTAGPVGGIYAALFFGTGGDYVALSAPAIAQEKAVEETLEARRTQLAETLGVRREAIPVELISADAAHSEARRIKLAERLGVEPERIPLDLMTVVLEEIKRPFPIEIVILLCAVAGVLLAVHRPGKPGTDVGPTLTARMLAGWCAVTCAVLAGVGLIIIVAKFNAFPLPMLLAALISRSRPT